MSNNFNLELIKEYDNLKIIANSQSKTLNDQRLLISILKERISVLSRQLSKIQSQKMRRK